MKAALWIALSMNLSLTTAWVVVFAFHPWLFRPDAQWRETTALIIDTGIKGIGGYSVPCLSATEFNSYGTPDWWISWRQHEAYVTAASRCYQRT